MTSKKELITLCFETKADYKQNLQKLISLILKTPSGSIVLSHEVCFTNFDYLNFDESAEFTPYAIEKLMEIVDDRTVIFSAITKRENGIYNVAYVLHDGKIIHEQAKSKLFKLGNEHDYFKEASEDEIKIVEVEGIKIAILICFELRFKNLWQQLQSADIVLIPAQWGRLRTDHFVTLAKALAIMNQCYVVASDAKNSDTTGKSNIVTPFGEQNFCEDEILEIEYKFSEIKKMRKYLDVGIV
jgi:omega-amidase